MGRSLIQWCFSKTFNETRAPQQEFQNSQNYMPDLSKELLRIKSSIDTFEEADDDSTNESIREYLKEVFSSLNKGLQSVNNEERGLLNGITKLLGQLNNETYSDAVQAFVFYVNPSQGTLTLNGYAGIEVHSSESFSFEHPVFENYGNLRYKALNMEMEELDACDVEIDDCDFEDEIGDMKVFLVLKSLHFFKQCFDQVFDKALLKDLNMTDTTYFFVAEHDADQLLLQKVS